MSTQGENLGTSPKKNRPLLFISHRHTDQSIADVLRRFVTAWSGGRVEVYQSSAPQLGDESRFGQELRAEIKKRLWRTDVIILVYTNSEEDWSWCMWECGVATHPDSAETKVVVFQCGPRSPSIYEDIIRVDVREPGKVQEFVNEFLTSTDFFPGYGEAIAPGFAPNGEEVQQAARDLQVALGELVCPDEGEDWTPLPFLRFRLTYSEVDKIREVRQEHATQGISLTRESLRITDFNGDATKLFGVGHIRASTPFTQLIDSWRQNRPDESTKWIEDLLEQIRGAAYYWRQPRFTWEVMKSADDTDSARYAPILARVRSKPFQRCHEFDVYFGKFATDNAGAIRIGFVNEPQTGPE